MRTFNQAKLQTALIACAQTEGPLRRNKQPGINDLKQRLTVHRCRLEQSWDYLIAASASGLKLLRVAAAAHEAASVRIILQQRTSQGFLALQSPEEREAAVEEHAKQSNAV